MLGVLYPLIFEYLYNEKISVGAPFYNSIYIPITIIAAAFLVFSIEINWNGSLSKIKLLHPLSFSIIFAFVITLYLYQEFEIKNILLLISLFVGYLIIIRYLFVLFMSKYINIASFCAHFGLGVLIVAISLNSLLSSERVLNLNINETKTYKGINITLEQIKVLNGSNYDSIKGFLKVNDGANQYILEPEKRRYFVRGQITTETDIKVTPIKDIYVTLGDQLDDGSWIVNIQLNYFIRYIWASMIMMALASLFIISNTRRQS
jgi:cytochrome c-type biogenesis protein CcmF